MCCEECFSDSFVKEYIRDNGERGECHYCDAHDVNCLEPDDLTELFQPVVDLYEIVEIGVNRTPDEDPTDVGESLPDLLDYGWGVFSDRLDYKQRSTLLSDIVNSFGDRKDPGVDVDDLWTERTKAYIHRSLSDYWDSFGYHITRKRRFIPDLNDIEIIDPQKLIAEAVPLVDRVLSAGTKVYRARLGHKQQDFGPISPIDLDEMGAPPHEHARGGRINPAGIPVLYTSLGEDTAVAEVRPWKGALVSVAKFALPADLRIVDVTDIPDIVTPFGIDDISDQIERRKLLRHVASDLAKPVAPHSTDVDYVPTQYLSEVIRALGFDGILYPSALGHDANLVIFDITPFRAERVRLVEVSDVNYTTQEPDRKKPFGLLGDL